MYDPDLPKQMLARVQQVCSILATVAYNASSDDEDDLGMTQPQPSLPPGDLSPQAAAVVPTYQDDPVCEVLS